MLDIGVIQIPCQSHTGGKIVRPYEYCVDTGNPYDGVNISDSIDVLDLNYHNRFGVGPAKILHETQSEPGGPAHPDTPTAHRWIFGCFNSPMGFLRGVYMRYDQP